MSFRGSLLVLVLCAPFVGGCYEGALPGPGDSGGAPVQPEDGVQPGADSPADDPLDPAAPDGDDGASEDDDAEPLGAVWSEAFDASGTGVLSAVWGSAPDDVFVVGGKPVQGEVYHFNGERWRGMSVPAVGTLVWVFGFGPDQVYAVGIGGAVIHYDGQTWAQLDAGVSDDLWGIWGAAPDDIWIVGGVVGEGEPLILHYDGATFTAVPMPANDRAATALFKVWGIGSKVFAVGDNGVIIEHHGQGWLQASAGPNADDDFVALWGTSENHIVAVGGRSSARIAVYDGDTWTTQKPIGVPGLNAVFMVEPHQAIVGGVAGYVGSFDPLTGALTAESPGTDLDVHGMWSDRVGRFYGVGGRFVAPLRGLALVRTLGDSGIEPLPPLPIPIECSASKTCPTGQICDAGACVPSVECAGDLDSDGDGIPDLCDPCPDDSPDDSDGDGTCNSADLCQGDDAGGDSDGDGVCDGSDACPLDQPDDSDGDGVCDSNDLCVGDDASGDTDGDGTCDAGDLCAGADASGDPDGDGLCSDLDSCPLDNPNDSDGDGVCDSADLCQGNDASGDTDGDGVCNNIDPCPTDHPDDSDNDGVCNSLDACPGFDDAIDSDGDGVPNACDTCEGSLADLNNDGTVDAEDLSALLGSWGPCPSDPECPADLNGDRQVNPVDLSAVLGAWGSVDDVNDSDGDGVADACDICPGSSDTLDADADGVPDGCDTCPGGDDHADGDGDGVPDSCDPCPADNPDDSDGDGVCNSSDLCSGGDDNADGDGDDVPDFCDPCPSDHPDDSDGDGVCNSADLCPGFDDDVDSDGNGIPDGCCGTQTDCDLGDNCNGMFCLPSAVPDLEIGTGGSLFSCVGGGYAPVVDGGVLTVCAGFQGFVEVWLDFRVMGFSPNALAQLQLSLALAGTSCTSDDDCAPVQTCLESGLCTAAGGVGQTNLQLIQNPGSGVNEYFGFMFLLFESPSFLDGKDVILSVTLTEQANPSLQAALEVAAVLNVE